MAQAGPAARSPLGMPFPYQLALQQGVYRDLLKAVKECKKICARSGAIYYQQITTYTSALPYHWELYPEDMTGFIRREITEQAIKRLFEKEGIINWSTSLPTLQPLVTTGDGNCLLHAAALYMWGIEDTELILRTSLYETLVEGSFSRNSMHRWQAERSSHQADMHFEFRYNTHEWNEEYDMLKSLAAPTINDTGYDLRYRSLEEFHIYALANMLRRPILVISSKKIRSLQGDSLQPQLVSGLYLPLEWDPSLCCKFPIVLGFSQSHFFPLVHTAPEDSADEADLMVPLVLHNQTMKVHFTIPGEDTEMLTKRYLNVDNFIHCPKNRETAVGLPGARLDCTTMGRNYSVWEPYFDLAETQLRIYNEGEYNPSSPSDLQERPMYTGHNIAGGALQYQGRAGEENISQQFQNLPPTARPSQQREQGQCKSPGCPYQQSLCTGELCVECFNKGQREKCRSGDCLNKADVGLDGFCKVCHDSNKFQQASYTNKPRGYNANSGERSRVSPPSSDDDRFKTNGDDLNSIAVNTLMSGMEKCMMPECQMTGNPKTADMCEKCYKAAMDVEKEMGRSSGASDESFVVVNRKGEEHPMSREQVSSDVVDRRAYLLSHLGLEDQPRSQQRRPTPAPRHDAQAQHIQSAPTLAKPPVITVQKDLCATAGCTGVRLKASDLCRGCKANKKVSREEPQEAPRAVLREVRMSPPLMQHSTYQESQRKCKIRKCNQQATAPPDYIYCHECLEDIDPMYQMYPSSNNVSQSTPVEAAGYGPPQLPYRQQDHASQRRDRNLSDQVAHGSRISQDVNPQYHMHPGNNVSRSTAGYGPPELPYRQSEYTSQHRDRNLSDQGAPGSGTREGNLSNQTIPRARRERGQENISSTPASTKMEDLDQQLRDQYNMADKSDSSPTKSTQEFFKASKQIERKQCQRPNGCPDKMYGDPEKQNLCSKCWKEVGDTLLAKNPKSTSEGAFNQYRETPKYQDTYGRNNDYSEDAVRPGTVRPPGVQERRMEQNSTYSGSRADSGYQHSQEVSRFQERNLSGRHGDPQRERAYPQAAPASQNVDHYQYPRGGGQHRMGYNSGEEPYNRGRQLGDHYRDEYQTGSRPSDIGVTNHVYEELGEQRCAQHGCQRPAGNNVEKFCDQCHDNYRALFMEYRQLKD